MMGFMSNTVRIPCSKCDGRGEYLHYGACFRCDGRGFHTVDAAKHAAMLAGKAARDAAYQRIVDAEQAAENAIHAFHVDACTAIARDGADGARDFFKAHRGNAGALTGLIGAMRDRGTETWHERANGIVRYMGANRATLDRSLTIHQGF